MAGAFSAMIYPRPHLVTLLQVIKRDGELTPLLGAGLEYAQIAELLGVAIAEGLVTIDESRVRVSDRGAALLSEHRSRERPESNLGPVEQYRTPRLPKDAVYLPVIPFFLDSVQRSGKSSSPTARKRRGGESPS